MNLKHDQYVCFSYGNELSGALILLSLNYNVNYKLNIYPIYSTRSTSFGNDGNICKTHHLSWNYLG